MGARKKNSADLRKEEKKNIAFAKLRNCPTSPRKMRLVADNIRGMEVNKALSVLKYTSRESAKNLEKLLLSAISNWQQKNEGVRLEDTNLFVKEIFVDGARVLKRLRTAPQGRGYRIRKRSNHVTILLGDINNNEKQNED